MDSENYECNKLDTEEETIKQCASIEIDEIISEIVGDGTFGMVFPIVANIGGKKETLVVKKITSKFRNSSEKDQVIKNMYYEVDYSYKMGLSELGPIIYDAFYYETKKKIHQYIIMEKFDMSVSRWIQLKNQTFTKHNCNLVVQNMLDLLHKQIFEIGLYCYDIKPDNYVINLVPIKVRMIDFGIDWCNSNIPDFYKVIPQLRNYSKLIHKEIFYTFCAVQLMLITFRYIYLQNQNVTVCKWLLQPFYTDKLLIKYIWGEKQVKTSPKRSRRRSLKKRHKIIDMKMILLHILEYERDQGIKLAHYLKSDKESNKDAADRIFKSINDITNFMNSP